MKFVLVITILVIGESTAQVVRSPRVDAGKWASFADKFHKSKERVRGLRGTPTVGRVYTGARNEQGEYHGMGELKVYDGTFYKGDFVNGVFHGEGLLLTSQEIYKGDFKDGVYNGHGALKRKATEDEYEGEFKDGVYHGMGTLTFANGDRYHGLFVNGLFDGIVRGLFPDGSTFEGEFDNGSLISSGIHRKGGGTVIFQGSLRGSLPDVQGLATMIAEFS